MADLNRTTAERFAARKRHVRMWNFARLFMPALMRRKYNFSYDDLDGIEPPYLLLCNNVTNPDPIFVGCALGHQGYFVATENLLHKGFVTRLLMRYFCPIIHQKGRLGLRSAKEIQQGLKEGAVVILFPEGSRTFNGLSLPVPPVTAKMARKAGHVVCVRFEGGYLTQPRWATTMRKGRLHLAKTLDLDAEAMKAMSDTELQDAIVEALSEDAYARQTLIAAEEGAPVAFKGKHLAMGMESTFFMCPDCGRIGTLTSDDAGVRCTAPECSFSATYLPTGYLEGGRFTTLTEWDLWQHAQLDARVKEDTPAPNGVPQPLFFDEVTVEHYNEAHELIAAVTGRLAVFGGADPHAEFLPSSAASVAGTFADKPAVHPESPIRIEVTDVEGVALFTRNTLIAHIGKPPQHFEVRGDMGFNALKYSYAFDALRRQAQ